MRTIRPKSLFCKLRVHWPSNASSDIEVVISSEDKQKIAMMRPLYCKDNKGNKVCINLPVAAYVEIVEMKAVHHG